MYKRKHSRKKHNKLRKLMLFVLVVFVIIPISFSKYTEKLSESLILTIRKPRYTVKFYSNRNDGNPDDIEQQSFIYGTSQSLRQNTFTNQSLYFSNWNTESNGSGNSYSDKEVVNNLTTQDGGEVALYAQWTNGIAELDGTYYQTLEAAIEAVPKDNTLKTINLLADTNARASIAKNQNIILNLNNHTVGYIPKTTQKTESIITNDGTITIRNGTLISTSDKDGVINNNQTGNITIENASVYMNATGGKQVLYNDKGTAEIKGNSYLYSASNPSNSNNQRATVQNQAGGTLIISGGTIVSEYFHAVEIKGGTFTIGTQDNNPDKTSPILQGKQYGVKSSSNYSFYNGTIKGETNAVSDQTKITNIETGYSLTKKDEIIGTDTYKTLYLAISNTVTFNPNGGTVSENTRNVENGEELGTLPVPTRSGYDFDGWFTLAEGGTQISANTVITQNEEFFAHWSISTNYVAEVNGVSYTSLQSAVNAVSENNTETTIKLLKDISESVTVSKNRNIKFDLQNFTLSNNGDKCTIENSGTVTIYNGKITSNAATKAAVNNNANATLTINGGEIFGKDRSAVYNFGNGSVLITGGYLHSTASGTPTGTTMERGAVQNLASGNMIITGGKIVGETQQAVSNEGILTFGTQGGGIDITSPEIIGKTVGIKTTRTFNYYDGIIKGITNPPINGTISDTEAGSTQVTGTETIDGLTYNTVHLSAN